MVEHEPLSWYDKHLFAIDLCGHLTLKVQNAMIQLLFRYYGYSFTALKDVEKHGKKKKYCFDIDNWCRNETMQHKCVE